MTPGEFIAKWRASELKERSASQEHFIDLCRLLGEPTPADADPTGERYCFERGARKDTGGDGWADVWKRHHFAWEYKGKHADLDVAFNQLRQYALALENPPLLIVSDMARFRVRTNWTNSVSVTHEFALDDLSEAAVRDKLKWAMSDPERLRPGGESAGAHRTRGDDFRVPGAIAAGQRPRTANGCPSSLLIQREWHRWWPYDERRNPGRRARALAEITRSMGRGAGQRNRRGTPAIDPQRLN